MPCAHIRIFHFMVSQCLIVSCEQFFFEITFFNQQAKKEIFNFFIEIEQITVICFMMIHFIIVSFKTSVVLFDMAHSFTRNVHSPYCGGGRRWTPLPGERPGFRREKIKTGWPPATSKMSSTGSRSCSEIFLHREQIICTEYSRSRWSSHHVVT